MPAPVTTVRVSGLPTDIGDNRLKDKLFIHFLRTRNGGGEIISIRIVKEKPGSALITFEDSGVAQRVIQHSQHILQLDEKEHELIVTAYHESLDPDQVVLSLSATVDYSQLPLGRMALTSLQNCHPDIQLNYDATGKLCTLKGPYSKVQAALVLLLKHPGSPQSAEHKYSDQLATQTSRTAHKAHKPHTQDSADHKRKPDEHAKQRDQVHLGRPSEVRSSHPYTHLTRAEYDWEDTGQAAGGARQLSGHLTASEEDLSLIVDADMFQYLLKHCGDYQRILSQYGVEVVDVTAQGVTTLFVQVATASREKGREQERLRLARNEIRRLYQENECNIRRAQMPKSILPNREALQMEFEYLNLKFPKLLLTEDDQNIYIVGNSSDVSEARQFLLLNHGKVMGKVEDVGSSFRYSFDSGSQCPPTEDKVPLPTSSTTQSLGYRIDNIVKSHENDTGAEGARKYKLAARFRDSGFAALSRPGDFTIQGFSSPGRQELLGPIAGHSMLSESAGVSGERFTRALAQNTGGDILFKSGDTALPAMSGHDKTFLNSDVLNTHMKSKAPSTSNDQSALTTTTFPPSQSGSSLKRARSFSGTPLQKTQGVGQKIQGDLFTSTARVRGRSSSFSSQTRSDKGEVPMTKIIVPFVLWNYIKDAYKVLLEDLSSDVRLKETHAEGSQDITVVLNGANMQKVSSCQQGLQKMVDRVSTDFSFQELSFSELGVTNPENETLLMCCTELRSRFKKIQISMTTENLCLCGPKQLCSQAIPLLREVFSGKSTQLSEQQSNFRHFMSTCDEPRDVQTITDQHSNLHCNNDPQQILKTESCVNGVGSVAACSNRDVSLCQKEMTTHSVVTQNDNTEHDQDMIKDSSGESTSGQGGLECICVCGQMRMLTRTKCGLALCCQCLDEVHVHCRVCSETEPIPQGIQGEMRLSKLPITIPGHYKDSTVKVTYCIPDGIQADNHPYPGQPFEGGEFIAYFPDCKEVSKLLPRLKKAFIQGLTFTVTGKESQARVTWNRIPHKTSIQGGKSKNGYPDSSYLTRLSAALTSQGILEPPVKGKQ